MRHYFLGMAAEYADGRWFRHLFTVGRKRDLDALKRFLSRKYQGEAMLCKNGRSALALALKAYFEPGDEILVNGFTCYAVYEAVKAAGLKPVFVDISKDDLNFALSNDNEEHSSEESNASRSNFARARRLKSSASRRLGESSELLSPSAPPAVCHGARFSKLPVGRNDLESSDPFARVRGIIIQNTLGNPVDIEAIEKLAKEYGLTIIEDLAHSAGVRYKDGRMAGTVGSACVFSFGKDKSIDTVSGGAVVLRDPCKHEIKAPVKTPKISDHLRAKFYPMFGAMCRGLTYVGLGGGLMRCLVKIHWVEKSADNRLSLDERPSKFEAKLALKQFEDLRRTGEPVLREFCFVRDRAEVLKKLQKKGYYFGGFWYERPVSPERYYKKVHFPEKECPNAVYVAEHILNLPTYYTRRDLKKARKIIKEYLDTDNEEKGGQDEREK